MIGDDVGVDVDDIIDEDMRIEKAKYPFFKWRRRHLRIFEIFFFYLKIRNISNTFMELIIDFPGISRKGCTYIDSVLSCVVFGHIWQLCGLKVNI